MGSGTWNVSTYNTRAQDKASAGQSTFDHTDQVRAGKANGLNPLVDPAARAGGTSRFAGQVMREVAISDEHPNPTAIAIVLDVTGSNYQAAITAHSKLPKLLGVLNDKGYADDPQILFGAIGDAHSDKVPLQIGQFESDNRIDRQLEAIYLEGNGGGQVHETYELAAYFLARHTHLGPLERFGRKGYVFFVGDEMPYDMILKGSYGHGMYEQHSVESLIGDRLEEDIPTEQIFAELQEKFEVFFLFQSQGTYPEERILPRWRQLLGERALVLDDPGAVCEFIAGVIGVLEANMSGDQVMEDLANLDDADTGAIKAARKALSCVSGGGAVVDTKPDIGSGDEHDPPTIGRL